LKLLDKPIDLQLSNPNQCEGINALKALKTLNSVTIGSQFIMHFGASCDLDLISQLTSLTRLQVFASFSPINLSQLKTLTRLRTLIIYSTVPLDLSALPSGLTTLHLAATRLSNLEPLIRLQAISDLSLAGGKISNFAPLLEIRHLKRFSLQGVDKSTLQQNKAVFDQLRNRGVEVYIDEP
jgi:hypothetical protein